MPYKTKNDDRQRSLWNQEREYLQQLIQRVQNHEPLGDLLETCAELRRQAEVMASEERLPPLEQQTLQDDQRQVLKAVLQAIEKAKQENKIAMEHVMRELRKSNEVRKVLDTYRSS